MNIDYPVLFTFSSKGHKKQFLHAACEKIKDLNVEPIFYDKGPTGLTLEGHDTENAWFGDDSPRRVEDKDNYFRTLVGMAGEFEATIRLGAER